MERSYSARWLNLLWGDDDDNNVHYSTDLLQVPEDKSVEGPQEDGQLSESQMAAEFAQLNLRKQVSYR